MRNTFSFYYFYHVGQPIVFPSFSLLISVRCGVEDLYINPSLIDSHFPAEYLKLLADSVGVYRSQWELLSGTASILYHCTHLLYVQLSTVHPLTECSIDVFQNVYVHFFFKSLSQIKDGKRTNGTTEWKKPPFCYQVTYSVMSLYFFVPHRNTKHKLKNCSESLEYYTKYVCKHVLCRRGRGRGRKKEEELVAFYPDSLITQLSVSHNCLFKLLSEMENSVVRYFHNFSMFNVLLMIARLSNCYKCIKDEVYMFSVLTYSILLLLSYSWESHYVWGISIWNKSP